MIKKLMPGVMVALIVLISLLGSGGQAFAATGGTSLSKWVYAEHGELDHNGLIAYGTTPFPTGVTEQSIWKGVDNLLNVIAGAGGNLYTGSQSVIWHVFERHVMYDIKNGAKVIGGYDNHYIVAVPKSANATPIREEGRLYFKNTAGNRVPYEYLGFKNSLESGEFGFTAANPPNGILMGSTPEHGITTVFEIMTMPYDPASPPAYAIPGNTEYNSSFPNDPDPNNPTNPTDPNFPVQPTPPDNNWDLIGWIKYIVDWLIYLVKCFVYFLKSFGTAIADVVNGSASLISAMTDFFAFLPNQVTTIIGMGIVAMIIVGVVKR